MQIQIRRRNAIEPARTIKYRGAKPHGMRGRADQGGLPLTHSPSTKVQVALRGAVSTGIIFSSPNSFALMKPVHGKRQEFF